MAGLVMLDGTQESKIFWRRAVISIAFTLIVVVCVWSLLDEGHQHLAVAMLAVVLLVVLSCFFKK